MLRVLSLGGITVELVAVTVPFFEKAASEWSSLAFWSLATLPLTAWMLVRALGDLAGDVIPADPTFDVWPGEPASQPSRVGLQPAAERRPGPGRHFGSPAGR